MNRLWGWLLIIALGGLLYAWQPDFFLTMYQMLHKGDIAALAEYLRSFGIWSVAVILGLFIILTFTIVFPFMLLSGAAGIIYGLVWGTAISWAGEVVGAFFMFIFARYFFRQAAAGWIARSPYLQKVDEYSAENGFKALLIARLLPLAPSGIITAVAAVSRMGFGDFFWATFWGKLPPVVIKVMLGHDLVLAKDNMVRLTLILALVVGIYVFLWWSKRKKRLEETTNK